MRNSIHNTSLVPQLTGNRLEKITPLCSMCYYYYYYFFPGRFEQITCLLFSSSSVAGGG